MRGAAPDDFGAWLALALASRELDRRLEGKGVGELREALGAAADLSEAEAAAALAEPAFVPPGSAPASADDGPPAPQRSLSSSLSEDALAEASISLLEESKKKKFNKQLSKRQVDLVANASIKRRTKYVLFVAAFVDLSGAVLLACRHQQNDQRRVGG